MRRSDAPSARHLHLQGWPSSGRTRCRSAPLFSWPSFFTREHACGLNTVQLRTQFTHSNADLAGVRGELTTPPPAFKIADHSMSRISLPSRSFQVKMADDPNAPEAPPPGEQADSRSSSRGCPEESGSSSSISPRSDHIKASPGWMDGSLLELSRKSSPHVAFRAVSRSGPRRHCTASSGAAVPVAVTTAGELTMSSATHRTRFDSVLGQRFAGNYSSIF